jgi:hypothetical protein
MPDYKWKPIEELPEELLRQESSELKALGEVWAEQKGGLDADGTLTNRIRATIQSGMGD